MKKEIIEDDIIELIKTQDKIVNKSNECFKTLQSRKNVRNTRIMDDFIEP